VSEDQRDWPKETLRNPDRSPLLAGAGCIRGYSETLYFLTDELLPWIAEMLEILNPHLVERLGPKWWINTPIEKLIRGESSDAE